jgi:hypothetical protein
MDELPANAAAVALASSVASEAMADLIELSEFLDVDVDHLARPFALVAAHRLGRLQRAQLVDAQPLQDSTPPPRAAGGVLYAAAAS